MSRTVLFLCTGNSCRSQIAEGFARTLARGDWEIYSAGLEPSRVDPRAMQVMAEKGIDLSGQASKGLDAVPLARIETLVTLCGDAEERCPMLPGVYRRIHWPLPDPARAIGNETEVLAVFRLVRDDIEWRVRDLLSGGTGARPCESP